MWLWPVEVSSRGIAERALFPRKTKKEANPILSLFLYLQTHRREERESPLPAAMLSFALLCFAFLCFALFVDTS